LSEISSEDFRKLVESLVIEDLVVEGGTLKEALA
jgi:hypothetical protein